MLAVAGAASQAAVQAPEPAPLLQRAAEASSSPSSHTLHARVAAIRSAWVAAEAEGTPPGSAFAAWMQLSTTPANWTNWPKWGKWSNWANK